MQYNCLKVLLIKKFESDFLGANLHADILHLEKQNFHIMYVNVV